MTLPVLYCRKYYKNNYHLLVFILISSLLGICQPVCCVQLLDRLANPNSGELNLWNHYFTSKISEPQRLSTAPFNRYKLEIIPEELKEKTSVTELIDPINVQTIEQKIQPVINNALKEFTTLPDTLQLSQQRPDGLPGILLYLKEVVSLIVKSSPIAFEDLNATEFQWIEIDKFQLKGYRENHGWMPINDRFSSLINSLAEDDQLGIKLINKIFRTHQVIIKGLNSLYRESSLLYGVLYGIELRKDSSCLYIKDIATGNSRTLIAKVVFVRLIPRIPKIIIRSNEKFLDYITSLPLPWTPISIEPVTNTSFIISHTRTRHYPCTAERITMKFNSFDHCFLHPKMLSSVILWSGAEKKFLKSLFKKEQLNTTILTTNDRLNLSCMSAVKRGTIAVYSISANVDTKILYMSQCESTGWETLDLLDTEMELFQTICLKNKKIYL